MSKSDYAVFPVAVAREMLRTFRRLENAGFFGRDTVEDLIRRVPSRNETPIFFRNDSGEECPPYACLQVIGTVEDGGQNYVLIDKPADTEGTTGEYLFNGHYAVADGEFGTSQGGGRLNRAIKYSGTATAGDNWNPKVNAWTIEQVDGGRFTMAGDDDIATDVARVFVAGGGGSGATIQYTINSLDVAGSGSPYNGLTVATVTIELAPCSQPDLIGTEAEVVDWSGCVFDQPEEDLIGVWGWASKYVGLSRESGVDAGTLTPCHWGADDRCCIAADGA